MRRSSPRPETPAAFARAIVLGARRRGVDPDPGLRRAAIAADTLADPSGRIAVDQLEALSDWAMRALDDEALGWFARPLPWGSYGMLCRASLTAPTLAVALGRWCRHHGLLTDDVRLSLSAEGATAAVRATEGVDLGDLREFCLVSLLRNLHGIACWLVDSRIALAGARFPFPAPEHAAAYGRMFGAAIAFDADRAGLDFDVGYLALPVVRDDAALCRMLQRPLPLMARQYRQDRLLSQRIAGYLAAHDGQPPDAADVARHLGISVRSLQRHLRDEGTSLIVLKSLARRTRAEELLRRGDLPLKRVARLVGYGHEASFGRAFLAWTGQTPADFRRAAREAPGDGPG